MTHIEKIDYLRTVITHVLIASEDGGDMDDIDWNLLRESLERTGPPELCPLNTHHNRRDLAKAVWQSLTLDDIYTDFMLQKSRQYQHDPDSFTEEAEWMAFPYTEE